MASCSADCRMRWPSRGASPSGTSTSSGGASGRGEREQQRTRNKDGHGHDARPAGSSPPPRPPRIRLIHITREKRNRPPEHPRPPWRAAIFGKRYASCACYDAAIINSPPWNPTPLGCPPGGRAMSDNGWSWPCAHSPYHHPMAIAGSLTDRLTNGRGRGRESDAADWSRPTAVLCA